MDDLVAFLAARLDEDEAAAKAVKFRSRFEANGHYVSSPGGLGNPPMPLADVIDAETAAHIARHDPARVLREVAAKRAIVAQWSASPQGSLPLTFALCCLASVYSDHPGYRPEWKP